MSQVGVTGVAAFGVAVVAIDNTVTGHDPFPALLAGGLFTVAVSVVSDIDEGLAMVVAATYLTAVLLLHSKSITDVLTKFANQRPTPAVSTAAKPKKDRPQNV